MIVAPVDFRIVAPRFQRWVARKEGLRPVMSVLLSRLRRAPSTKARGTSLGMRGQGTRVQDMKVLAMRAPGMRALVTKIHVTKALVMTVRAMELLATVHYETLMLSLTRAPSRPLVVIAPRTSSHRPRLIQKRPRGSLLRSTAFRTHRCPPTMPLRLSSLLERHLK